MTDKIVEQDNTVHVEYEGKFENGEVFDSSSKAGVPLQFKVGAKMVVPGFENAIVGMKEGEEKEVTIPAKEAYGEVKSELEKQIPKETVKLPEGQEVKVGMTLGMQAPNGQQFPVQVKAVDETTITLDLNHPLAGKNLIFKLKVVKIE